MSFPSSQEIAFPAVVDQPGHSVIVISADDLKDESADLSKTHWWNKFIWVPHGHHHHHHNHHIQSYPDGPPDFDTPDQEINQQNLGAEEDSIFHIE